MGSVIVVGSIRVTSFLGVLIWGSGRSRNGVVVLGFGDSQTDRIDFPVCGCVSIYRCYVYMCMYEYILDLQTVEYPNGNKAQGCRAISDKTFTSPDPLRLFDFISPLET